MPLGYNVCATAETRVEDFPIRDRPQQLDILRVRPHQRHGRPGKFAQFQAQFGDIGGIPDLLRQHATLRTEAFKSLDIRPHIVAGGQLVVRSLSGQERPCPALPPAQEGPAIVALPVAVMVIASPAWPDGGFHLKHVVDHLERIDHTGSSARRTP